MSNDWEYTLEETIAELENWNQGGRMFPIEVAISAVHWLEQAPSGIDDGKTEPSLQDTLGALRLWLTDETPHIPDSTALAALHWLKRVKAAA